MPEPSPTINSTTEQSIPPEITASTLKSFSEPSPPSTSLSLAEDDEEEKKEIVDEESTKGEGENDDDEDDRPEFIPYRDSL